MKKILALVLALLMSVSCASLAFAAETAEEPAVAETAAAAPSAAETYAEAIAMLDAYGIMKGVDPEKFDADADSDIQRYQMALFVGRISTGWIDDAQWTDGNVNNSGFDDLDGTPAQNYYGAISYAYQKGIIEGYGDKKFGPTDGITYRDALTMVVRTLGYGSGLKYPWGYIETAESLGLTKGISGVAYTAKLNRGEVAQIIYNALFLTTSKGDTLAARNPKFAGDLVWKTIIVTVTDIASIDTTVKAGVPAASLDEKASPVGFRVVKANGQLEDKTYFIARSKLGIGDGEHDDEAALGYAYKLLFTDDGSTLVKSLGRQDISLGTKKNEGRLAKDPDGKYPIEAALAGLSVVGKFDDNVNYVNVNEWQNAGKIILKDVLGGAPVVFGSTKYKYAIDWDTANIYELDSTGTTWTIAWYYNSIIEKYFRTKFSVKDTNGNVKVLGIEILDDPYALGSITFNAKTGGMPNLGDKPATSAYAKLDLFDLTLDGTADYGLYTSYRFAKFSTGKVVDDEGKEKAGYILEELNLAAKYAWELSNEGKTYGDYMGKKVEVCAESKKGGVKGYITGATPESGDYVIYSYNYLTGELHIEKIVDKDASDKTYYATGLVRAYDVNARTVTIGNEKLTFDYAELKGNPMIYDGDKAESKAIYGEILGKAFMNIVKYVVVDDRLVYIEPDNVMNGSKYIFVDSYAGISADGYVVVNAYRSDALKYEQIRIGAYDQWLKGDIYNYALSYTIPPLFNKGAIYKITSYDKDNDAYYVSTDIDFETKAYTVIYNADGYKSTDGGKTWTRAKADDTYIFVLDPTFAEDYGYAPIQVYTGKGGNGWTFSATGKIKGLDNSYTGVTLGDGFNLVSKYALTYGLLVSANYDKAQYISADDAEGKTLMGATYFGATVIDLYTGKYETVKILNKGLTQGLVYPVVNGQITNVNGIFTIGYDADEVEISGVNAGILEPARPSYGYMYDYALTADQIFDVEKLSKKLSKDLVGKEYKDIIKNKKVFSVTVNADGTMSAVEIDKAAKLPEVLDTYDTFMIYGWKGAFAGDNSFAIIYVIDAGSKTKDTAVKEAADNKLIVKPDEVFVTGDVEYTVSDDATTIDLDKVTLTFTGDKVDKDTHYALYKNGFYFGVAGACTHEDWETKVSNGTTTKPVYGSLTDADGIYHPDGVEADYIQKIIVDIPDAVGKNLKKGDKITITFTATMDPDNKTVTKDSSIVLTVADITKTTTGTAVKVTTYDASLKFATSTVVGISCEPTT